MLGLVLSGSWLTMQAARLASRLAPGVAGLLSARRLVDNPKAAFRSVSGLVLAVFVGTAIAGLVPAVESGMHAASGGALNDVLRVSFAGNQAVAGPGPGGGLDGGPVAGPGTPTAALPSFGLSPSAAGELLGRLGGLRGVTALPVYADPSLPVPEQACTARYDCAPTEGVVRCQELSAFPALGRCPAGLTAVRVEFGNLFHSDSGLLEVLPVVGSWTRPAQGDPRTQPVIEMLIRSPDPVVREQIRTLLAGYLAQAGSANMPQTYSEVAKARSVLYDEIERITLLVCAVTLIVAGCSLTVSVAGGLLERKRPFTLLRLAGTPVRTLYRVVLLESALPLLLTAVVAAAAGLATAAPLVGAFADRGVRAGLPGGSYFLILGVGLLVSLTVILTTLPLLRRLTEPEEARFE